MQVKIIAYVLFLCIMDVYLFIFDISNILVIGFGESLQ